jgi:hypothetical protein
VISPNPPLPSRWHILAFRASPAAPLWLLLFVLCLGQNAPATAGPSPRESRRDQPYALIFGTVWGPGDQPLYGVRVKIRRESEKKARWEQYSDHHGEFAVRLPAGKQDYVVWADLKGYKAPDGKRLHGQEMTIHVEYDERVDTGLHLK